MPYQLIFLTCFLAITTFAWGDQLIVEPEMGRKPIIDAINNAHQSIKLIMYGFTDEKLLIPILKQKAQGRTVNIILDKHPYKAKHENEKTIARLMDNQVDWQGNLPSLNQTHQKTLIIDGKKAIVMTFNFTRSTFKNERNFALVLDSAKQVKEIEALFNADWYHKLSAPIPAYLIRSPENSRKEITTLIKQAKHSILIYAQSISDYAIIGELAKASRKGLEIKILTSERFHKRLGNYLARAGISILRSKGYYIHAKTLIFDHQYAVIGSTNLTRASLDDNRELSVITNDHPIIQQLSTIFEKDWQATLH